MWTGEEFVIAIGLLEVDKEEVRQVNCIQKRGSFTVRDTFLHL